MLQSRLVLVGNCFAKLTFDARLYPACLDGCIVLGFVDEFTVLSAIARRNSRLIALYFLLIQRESVTVLLHIGRALAWVLRILLDQTAHKGGHLYVASASFDRERVCTN